MALWATVAIMTRQLTHALAGHAPAALGQSTRTRVTARHSSRL